MKEQSIVFSLKDNPMARLATLPRSFFDHDYAALAKTEKHPRTKIRLLALSHIKDGLDYAAVAKIFRVARYTIMTWVQRIKEEGISGLEEKGGRGKKPALSSEQVELFVKKIEDARDALSGGRLFGKDIQIILEKDFNKQRSLSTIYNILSSVDYVWITARSKHASSDTEKQEEFKKNFKKKFLNACQKG